MKNKEIVIKPVLESDFNAMLKTLPKEENMSIAHNFLLNNFKNRIYELECHELTEEFVGAFMDNELVGLIWFPEDDVTDIDTADNKLPVLISDLWVHPNYISLGIGKKLVMYAIDNSDATLFITGPFDYIADNFFYHIGFNKNLTDNEGEPVFSFSKTKDKK